MTIPWLMNCAHTHNGLCLECVKKLRKSTLEDAAKQCEKLAKNGRKSKTKIGRNVAGALDLAAFIIRDLK